MHAVDRSCELLQTVVKRNAQLFFAGFAAAGGNENYTVGAANAKYGRCRGILQDGYRLDLVGVEGRDAAARHTIDKYQRVDAVGGAGPAQIQSHIVGAGTSRRLHGGQTGELPREGGAQVGLGTTFQVVGAYRGN